MIKIQKYWILVALGAFSVVCAMSVDNDSTFITYAPETSSTTNSSDTSSSQSGGDPYHYTTDITNPDTGSTLTVEVATDGHDWGAQLSYNPVEQDNYNDRSSSASEPEARSDVTSEKDSWNIHDSYADSVLDGNMRDNDYGKQQRNTQGYEPARATTSKKKKPLPNRTYSLDVIRAQLRAAELAPGYYTKIDNEIVRIKADMDHAWTGNAIRNKQVQFLKMMVYGNLPACLSRIQHGTMEVAQKEFNRLKYFWPWPGETSFLIRNASKDEQAFIALIGSDILKEAERCLASRQPELYPSLLRLHHGYLEQQMHGDLQGLQKLKIDTHAQLSEGRAKKWTVLSYRWVILDTIIADPVTHVLDTIAHGSLSEARIELQNLQQQVCQFYRDYNVTSMALASATMVEQHGFDLLQAGQASFQNRPDYDPRTEFEVSDVRTMIFKVITDGTLQEATSELHSFETQLDDHFTQYKVMPENQAAYMIANHGYDVRAIARALYKARSDYNAEPATPPLTTTDLPATGAQTTASSYVADSTAASSSSAQSHQQEGWHIPEVPREMRSARTLMLEALGHATGQVQLADTIDGVRREVFDLARLHNYEIHSEVQDRVHTSIGIIRVTEYAHELVFHVAVVDRVLSDIQIQAAPEVAQQATLLERSPALLVHGLKTFVSGLNPIAQVKGLCELLVDTARFTCDMTVGKLYLSPQEYQARKDGFWRTMDALSPENLAQLSAEHWVELAANMAAGVVVGGGIYKTVRYLKEIEATSRAVRQAAKIAGALKGAVDTVLREHPILVTAEGVLISNYDKIEEVTEEVVAVVKNSQTLLEVAAQKTTLLQDAVQKTGEIGGKLAEVANNSNVLLSGKELSQQTIARTSEILKNIQAPLESLVKNGNKIKEIANPVFNVGHTFSPEHAMEGIFNLGDTAEKITEDAIAFINRADLSKLLVEGTNVIRAYINGKPVEIHAHTQGNLLRSINFFAGHSNRIVKNLIKYEIGS